MISIQSVYADLLFLVNFSMDMLCLILVARLTSQKVSLLRTAVGAMIGGIYSVAILFVSIAPPAVLMLHILCCLLMCAAVFGKSRGIRGIISNASAFLISSTLLGGIMTAAFSLLNSIGVNTKSTGEDDLPPWLIIGVGLISAIAARIGGKSLKAKASRRFAEVEITLCGKKVSVYGVCDSGNLLREPISGRSVVVIDDKYTEKFFLGKKVLTSRDLPALKPDVRRRTAVIPFHTASGEKNMVAFRPEKLTVKNGNKFRDTDALIGFAKVDIPDCDAYALIPPELL